MSDPSLLALVAAAFVLGGFVKGTLGVGLPLVAVPLMSLALPGHRAIGLVVIPVLCSNAWQAWETRVPARELRRFVPLVIALVVTTFITVRLTLSLSEHALAQMIAGAVLIAVGLMAWQPTLNVSPRSERRWGFAVGGMSGLMGGVSSLTGPLIITYLMALRLPRETFVGCISVIYLCSAIPLYSTMLWHGRIGVTELALSLLALLPMWCGLRIGRACRARLGEHGFRRLLLACLSLLAVALIAKSI
jgi:uncharacterized membrane protein YfcA